MPKKITYNSLYKGLKINVNAEKGYGCHEQFLETYHQHLMDMCSKYSKVFQLRFDLRYPADNKFKHASYTPRQLSIFSENLTKDLKRNHPIYPKGANASQPLRKNPNKVDPRIIKVCEIGEKSDKTHIHGLILVNGNAKKCSSDLYARIERQWANALDIEFEDAKGLVNYCNSKGPNSYLLERNKPDFEEKLNSASYQASYLGKIRSKEKKEKGAWLVTASRIPKLKTVDDLKNKKCIQQEASNNAN